MYTRLSLGTALLLSSLVGCSSKRDLGAIPDGGGATTGSAGTGGLGGGGKGDNTAGTDGGGTTGATGSGGTSGATGQAGSGGAAGGQAMGVLLMSNPLVAGQAVVTILNLQTGARGPTAVFNDPNGAGWSAADAKILPDGQVRLLWSGGSGGLLYRLTPSLSLIDSVTYPVGSPALGYVHHPNGTGAIILYNSQVVRLDASDRIDGTAPVTSVTPFNYFHSFTMAPDGTSRVFIEGNPTPQVVTLNAADQPTAVVRHAGNRVNPTTGPPWTPLSYQVERGGLVHILWVLFDYPNSPNDRLQTVLCTYPNEDAIETFPAQPEAGAPPCEQQPATLFMYTSAP